MEDGAEVSKSDDILCLPRSARDYKYQGLPLRTRRKGVVEADSDGHEAECRGVADPGSSRDAAAFYRSRAQERTLPPGRSRYNNCFIVHSLSLTRALYVSTVSDRFA